ncbi:MAG: radical SAM protein [Rhodospirillales bacterium]|nr:radical SAM protein [Rhodospirillales bacterium]
MITLINPPGIKPVASLNMNSPSPPLGLAYIAGTLRGAGYVFHVIDATGAAFDQIRPYPERKDFLVQGLTVDEIVARIPSDTDIVGFSCIFSSVWPLTRGVAHAVRHRFPKALLVLGGEHGTAVPEYSLREGPFDVIVLGEGEETFVKLVKAHRAERPLRDVGGLALISNGEYVETGLSARTRAVDDISLPAWDRFPIEEYIARHQTNGINLGRSMPLLATRGCPYTCTFCSSPNMWTTRYIPRNPKLVADEMESYIAAYGVSNFDFQDLTAVVKRSWVIEFCWELINRGLQVTWQMPSGTRCEIFDEEVADLLYRSGCRVLAFAPESGAPDMLELVQKNVNLDHLLRSVRIAVARRLTLSCFFVIGFPGETSESLRKTAKLVRKLAWLGVHDVAVTKFIPYPGSTLFRTFLAEKKITLNDEFFISPLDYYSRRAPSYANTITAKRLYWTMIWMFLNFYVLSFARRPIRTFTAVAKAIFTGIEATRYSKWLVDRVYTRSRWKALAKRAN